MTTYRQLVYLILDTLKMTVDDNYFTEDHIIFLLNKFRGLLLKQTYKDIRKEIPDSNYQTICLDIVQVPSITGIDCGIGAYFKSSDKIPFIIPISIPKIYDEDYHQQHEFAYISKDRMKYVGYNKWLSNMIYATIGQDNYLYFKSSNTNLDIDRITFTAIFENPEEVINFVHTGTSKDILDEEFPIEEALVPQLVQLVVKELIGSAYRPEDSNNNASDDLSNLMAFIRNNTKSNLQKQIEGDE